MIGVNESVEILKRQLLRLDDNIGLEKRIEGLECWPKEAETMIGLKRIENIQYCIEEILKNNVLGDLIDPSDDVVAPSGVRFVNNE
jgi:hypothetical protein